jgi:hypothetical protein
MRETTASEIERINVIILLVGSAVSIIVMRSLTHFFSFAVASSIMILNFRYLRRIIEGFFARSVAPHSPEQDHQTPEEATKTTAISKGELLFRLPLKFTILIALIVVILMWGHVNIPFFVIGLSTVLLSIVISQVVVAFSPEAGRKQNGT